MPAFLDTNFRYLSKRGSHVELTVELPVSYMRDQFPFPSLMRHPVSFLKHSSVPVTHGQTGRAISWYSLAYSEKLWDRNLTHGGRKWWRCEQACNKCQNTDDGERDGLWKVGWSEPPEAAVIRCSSTESCRRDSCKSPAEIHAWRNELVCLA